MAVTTQGQLRALKGDAATHKVSVSLDRPPTVKASLKRKTQSEEGTSSPIAKATLDKDASGHKMTDWEYLIWLNHDSPMAGHPGSKQILELLIRSLKFARSTELAQKIENYVKACIICAQGKPMQQKPYRMLQPLSIPSGPWQDIAMDFIMKLLPFKDFLEPGNPEYNLVWVILDRFTKMACFLPYRKDTGADVLARQLLKDIFAKHRLPQSIVLDRGSVFVAKFTKALYKALDVKRNLLIAFYPQTDSQTERTNQTLEQYLCMYCNHLQTNWVDLLPMALFAYNNGISASTGHSLFFLNYGYHPRHNISPNAAEQILAAKKYLKKLANIQEKGY